MKRKTLSLVAFIMAAALTFGLTACEALSGLLGGNESSSSVDEKLIASVESTTETMVVIKVEKAEEETILIDVMEYLQEGNELAFKVTNGMITEINGKANDVDYDPCWMLYTSDAEMSNTAWGTCEYNGQTFGSAVLGAEALPVIDGGVYVWSYQGF